jgi:thiamine biosynthesis lipoprotein
MRRATFQAMGTSIDVKAATDADIAATQRLFCDVESWASRFIGDSELSRVNADSRSRVPVSSDLAAVLGVADHARVITSGLVDIGIGRVLSDWGYDRTFDSVFDHDEQDEPLRRDDPAWVLENRELVRSPGTAIDLGGIAKGWTCDLAVERGLATVVSAGGDVRSADPDTTVEIADPWNEVAAEVRLGVGALATSSVSRRRWRFAGRDVNHLIDPRTMRPTASPVLSASAVTATATHAEAAAKAILLLGVDGLAWADEQPWIEGAVVVWADGCVYATTGLDVAA